MPGFAGRLLHIIVDPDASQIETLSSITQRDKVALLGIRPIDCHNAVVHLRQCNAQRAAIIRSTLYTVSPRSVRPRITQAMQVHASQSREPLQCLRK